MTNKLSAEELDKDLMDRDARKPFRKVVDDKVIPAGGMLLGGAAAAVSALGNLKQNPNLKEVN